MEGTVAISGYSYSSISGEVEEDGNSTVTVNDASELYINNTAITSSSIAGGITYPFDVGLSSGSQSTFNLIGPGTAVILQEGDAIIGDSGIGVMTVASGAELVIRNYGSLNYEGQLVLAARAPASQGTLTVTGQGSYVQAIGGTTVGLLGKGMLSVLAGADMVSNGLEVGEIGRVGSGSVLVSGPGSQLTGGSSNIGDAGAGSLTIADAGSVRLSQLTVSHDGGSGTVLVEDAGSNLDVTGEIDVGFIGNGSLTIGEGSSVSASTLMVAYGGDSDLNLAGPSARMTVGGDATFGDTSAGGPYYSDGGYFHAIVSIVSGSQLSVGGAADLKNGEVLLGGGALDVSGTLTIDAGTMLRGRGTVQTSNLINSGKVQGTGGPLSFIGGITGIGNFEIYAGDTLSFGSSVGSGLDTIFESGSSNLVLGAPSSFASTIYDFFQGDTIDLSKTIASSLTYSGQTLTVHESDGASLALKFSGAYAQSNFGMTSDGHSGTFITHT